MNRILEYINSFSDSFSAIIYFYIALISFLPLSWLITKWALRQTKEEKELDAELSRD